MTDSRSLEHFQQSARRHWREVALSTEPIAKHKAASAIKALYEAATGRPPAYTLFFDSPLQADIASNQFTFNFPEQPISRELQRSPLGRTIWENPVVTPSALCHGASPTNTAGWKTRSEPRLPMRTSRAQIGHW